MCRCFHLKWKNNFFFAYCIRIPNIYFEVSKGPRAWPALTSSKFGTVFMVNPLQIDNASILSKINILTQCAFSFAKLIKNKKLFFLQSDFLIFQKFSNTQFKLKWSIGHMLYVVNLNDIASATLHLSCVLTLIIRGSNFVLHPKFIPKSSVLIKLHKYVFRYALEIYYPNFFNKSKFINKSRDLHMTSLWNSPLISRSNSHNIKNAVTLSKTDI